MVDYFGNWTYEKDTPLEKRCDLDRIAQMIEGNGYKPKTTIENLTEMIALSYDGYLSDNDTDFYVLVDDPDSLSINPDDVKCFVEANGGFDFFDYYC